jgi:hypothetical protein
VIRDLSLSLRNLLEDAALAAEFPELQAATVVFDRPTSTFNPAQTSIDLFLYDIRENTELRSNERQVVRNGAMATVHKPPVRIECSYLVTAWPVAGAELPLQEHNLLSQSLQVLLRNPTLPAPFLVGPLVGQEPPLPMIVPEVNGLKSAAEFWTSMDNQLRASFTVSVTISVPAMPPQSGPIVTTKAIGLSPGTALVEETLLQVGGQVFDAGGNGVEGAIVDILDTGLRTVTDAEGRYVLARVPAGNRTLRVVAVGFQVVTTVVPVPGSPHDYEITLAPI